MGEDSASIRSVPTNRQVWPPSFSSFAPPRFRNISKFDLWFE
jgi:hypothetical protein